MDYIINIDEFEGPLDLLLHLVKTSKVDISVMNTTKIIEGYLEYINKWQDLNIDIASEYLVMAAELLHLKSKMILNITDESDEEDEYSINSEEELKQKIMDYEKYKNLVPIMNELKEEREEYYTKLPENVSNFYDANTNTINGLSIIDLQKALERALKREQKMKPVNTKITQKEISVTDKIKNIRNILKEKKKVNFIDMFDSFDKTMVVVTFLAILDMSKNGEIVLTQEDNFSNILLESRNLLWN